MLKKIFLLLLISLPSFIKAQNSYDIKFDNGETKKVEFPYDDPDRLPRYVLTFDFFGFMVTNDGMLTYQLKPEYRINKKMMLTGTLSTPYAKKMDPTIGDHTYPYTSQMKKTMDASILFHYSLFSLRNPVNKKVSVDYGGNSVYVAKLPRVIAKTLLAEGGFYYFRSPTNMGLDNLNTTQTDTFYSAINVSSLSMAVGLSFYHHQSYQVKSNGVSRSYFRYSRLYAQLTYAITENYTAVGMDIRNGFDNGVEFTPTSGYTIPTLSKVGWRIGFDKHMGFLNSNCTGHLGIEFGSVPYIKLNSAMNGIVKSPDQFFRIHFGVGFGAKPIK